MLLGYSSDSFVFQINQQRRHLQSLLRALFNAVTATVALCSVNYNVELARTVGISIMSDYDISIP